MELGHIYLIFYKKIQCCRAGAPTFRGEPEPSAGAAFFKMVCTPGRYKKKKALQAVLRSRLRLHLLASRKGKPCVVTKHDIKAVYNGKCDPKKT